MKTFLYVLLSTSLFSSIAFAGTGTETGNLDVPEPSSLLLFGIGILALILAGINRKR